MDFYLNLRNQNFLNWNTFLATLQNQNYLKIEKLILFSDSIRKLLQKFKTILIIIRRIVLILIKWNKRLSVKSLRINDSLFISNGLLIINWEIANFLWIKINSKICTLNSNGIVLHYDRSNTPIKIKVIGLFGKYKNEFPITPVATIKSKNIKVPLIEVDRCKIAVVSNSISLFKPKDFNFSLSKIALASNIKSINIILPNFKIDNYHE